MNKKQLSPCGCGGEAGIVKHEFYGANPTYSVTCPVCGMQTRQFYKTETEAVRVWNKAMGERTAKVKVIRMCILSILDTVNVVH